MMKRYCNATSRSAPQRGLTLIELLACQPKPWRRQAQAAFTLIELLVVIAIIALLVSILMPSLRSALELANISVCQNHLRHQGMGLIMFLGDNDGVFPMTQWFNGSTLYPDYIGPYVGFPDSKVIQSGGQLYGGPTTAGWFRGEGIWGCPTRMDQPPFVDPYGGKYYACYGMTHRGDGSGDWYSRRIINRSDDGIIILADASNSALLWYANVTVNPRFSIRHGQNQTKTNLAFLDGHGETVEWDQSRLCINLIPWPVPGQ